MSNRILIAIALTVLSAVGCTNKDTINAHTALELQDKDAGREVRDEGGRESLRTKLAEHRREQLERLEAYATAGRFPQNVTQPTPSHQLKDASGTYCAVANLVVQDGLGNVIDAKSKTQNDLLFGDLKDGQLYSWILTSGLTQEEVAAIQAPAPYVGERELSAPVRLPEATDDTKERAATAALREHFREVERQILANTDQSLDLATSRLEDGYGARAVSML